MEGHARTSGRITDKIQIGGKAYTLRTPPVGALIAEMEAYIVSLRSNPFTLAAEAVDRLPPTMPEPRRRALADRIWQAAEMASIRAGAATAQETQDFENSLRGIAWKFWVCIREDHAEDVPHVDAALSLLERYMEESGSLREIMERTSNVTGETIAKNSSGPTPRRSGKRKRRRRSSLPAGRPS